MDNWEKLLFESNDALTRKLLGQHDDKTGPMVHYLFGKPLGEIMQMIDQDEDRAAALAEAQATIARQQVLLNRALESNGDMQITIARLEARLADVTGAAARLDDARMDQMRRLCDFAVAFAAEVADTYPAAAKSFCEGLAALSPGKGE